MRALVKRQSFVSEDREGPIALLGSSVALCSVLGAAALRSLGCSAAAESCWLADVGGNELCCCCALPANRHGEDFLGVNG